MIATNKVFLEELNFSELNQINGGFAVITFEPQIKFPIGPCPTPLESFPIFEKAVGKINI